MNEAAVGPLVEHLFRHESGRLLATLTRIFGPQHLDLAEEVVQDALLRALQVWPFRGVPENPAAWLVQTARHRALDLLRRRALHDRTAPLLAAQLRAESSFDDAGAATEDQLRLLFMCCHPSLARDAQVALMLNVAAGFSAKEVARAFLLAEPAAAQRLVRAKRRLRELAPIFEVPPPAGRPARLAAVLDALYLIFNEGYAPRGGQESVRRELCAEAMRLARLLLDHPATDAPAVHALLALMCFQASRLAARLDDGGEAILLEEQDRSLWEPSLISAGFAHLARAAAGDELTPFHAQAGIAACHAAAPDWASTDWTGICAWYDRLLALQPTPVVALNRAIALAMRDGPGAGLRELEPLQSEPALQRHVALQATLAELHRRAGRADRSRDHLRAALALDCSPAERRLLERRLAALERRDD